MAGDWEIACEQFVWWRGQGLTPHEMLVAVGHPRPPANPTAEYTVDWLARVHRLLPQVRRERAA